jgi:hypothetical protein
MSSNKETDLRKQSYNYRVNYTVCMIRHQQYLGSFRDQDTPCSALALYEHATALQITKSKHQSESFRATAMTIFSTKQSIFNR